ncbi:ABC transporter ATP-binding protein [Sulfurospirillum sp.]|uniref:ABC transporter ATP-binding protein n=1 Tax=Sulfurospirillum sp. TaxID=2053622 RepID=UPI002FDE46B8
MLKSTAIKVNHLTKIYKLYDKPIDMLKEALHPLKKQYHKPFYALDNINFEIKRGETVGIIGQNGAGKSTLLKIITGVITPTSGSVNVNGRIASLLELGAGFNPEYTGIENIYLQGTLMYYSRDEINQKVDEILAFADIGDFIHQPVKSYSSGMFARLAFAIAINVDPDILIVDEALAVGDVFFVQKCMAHLKNLKNSGKTILFVSHDSTIIKNICDKALFINNGKLVIQGNAIEVTDNYLAHIFQRRINQSSENNINRNFFYYLKENEENYIPNLQKRLGNQRCQVLGIGLYDKNMNPIQSINNNSTIILRMTFQNTTDYHIHNLTVGYILKTSKGIEIASNNNEMEQTKIGSIGIRAKRTIKIEIKIPFLHPGQYTFTPTVGMLTEESIELLDRVENAICIELYSKKQIHVLMSLDTNYLVED